MPTTIQILALHGFTGSGADFEPFANMCLGTWQAPDLPGHGTADSLSCSPESTTQMIQGIFEKLPQRPRVLVGYSMGARAALNHVISNRAAWDGLILFSPNPGIETKPTRESRRLSDEVLAKRIQSNGLTAFLEYWQSTPLIQSQNHIQTEWLNAMQENRRQHTAAGLAKSLREFGQGSCPNLWPKLGNISVPILCVTGQLDTKYHTISARITRNLPNASHIIIPNAGHMPHLEEPEACANAVNQFLERFTESN